MYEKVQNVEVLSIEAGTKEDMAPKSNVKLVSQSFKKVHKNNVTLLD